MPKAEWGTKRVCPTTGKRFYDLNRSPIVSPYTGEVVQLDTGPKSRALAAEKAKAKAKAKPEAETEEEDVVLEDDEASTTDVDIDDDLLEDEDDDDNVSLDDIADVSSDEDDN